MVHKKYIKKRGKIFGPYYYENYRENGKTKTRYLGTKPPKETRKNLWVNPKTYFLIILGLLLISTFAYYLTKLEVTEDTPIKAGFLNSSLSLIKSIIGFSISDDVKDSSGGTTSNTILVLDDIKNKSQEPEDLPIPEEILPIPEDLPIPEVTLPNQTTEGQEKAAEKTDKIPPQVSSRGKGRTPMPSPFYTNETQINILISTLQFNAIIFQPVKWKKTVSLDKKGKVKIRLPKEAENITVYSIEESIDETKGKKDVRKQIPQKRINQRTISGRVIEELLITNFFSKIFSFITGRTITTEKINETIELTIDENATKYEISYETPAPISFEQPLTQGQGKRIIISGPDNLNYTNILAYTTLPTEVIGSTVHLYWLREENISINGTNIIKAVRQEVNIVKYDTNNNSLIDYIEWIVPVLSNQTYDLIIEISKAEHLDENRTFIEDVFEYVKARDNNWTSIQTSHYLRITFRKNLTNERDITIYARSNNTGSIEVYENNGTEVIASFENINEDKKYQIFLTNLSGSQDVFDLKILNNPIEFDYIVDPAATYNISFVDPTPANSTTTANTSVTINVSILNAPDISEIKFNWNGTNYTIYNDSLIFMMNFDNVSALGENDTFVVDVSKYGNNGTIQFGTTINVTGGKYNGAFEYDGNEDYIKTKDIQELDDSDEITGSAWVYHDAITKDDYIMSKWASSNGFLLLRDDIGEATGRNDTYTVVIYDSTDTSTVGLVGTHNASSLNNWTHVAFTYIRNNATGLRLYINGVEDANSPVSTTSIGGHDSGTQEFEIGQVSAAGDALLSFNGTIDEVRVWNRSLSAAEIQQEYFLNLRKFDTDKWNLYVNQSKNSTNGLDDGTYTYQAFVADTSGNENSTEERTINIATGLLDCTDITTSGTYALTQEINVSSANFKANCINITANDIILDCQNNIIRGNGSAQEDNGIIISRVSAQTTNITIRNCEVTNWDTNGIFLERADNNRLENLNVSGNADRGILLDDSDSNTFTNITANSNSAGFGILFNNADSNNLTNITANSNIYGIRIDSSNSNNLINIIANSNDYGVRLDFVSNSNTLTNITANSNSNTGIYIFGNSNKVKNSIAENQSGTDDVGIYIIRDNNTIENNTIKSNYRGIYLDSTTDNNTIVNNTIENSSNYGIYLSSAGPNNPNIIYNNLLNNTNNTFFAGTINTNYWNTTNQTGVRIFSNGPNIGGNYWTNSTGNGFSDTCVDAGKDGFCDLGYNVTTDSACTVGVNCSGNTDFLAYSDEGPIVDCVTINSPGSYVLGKNLSIAGENCININSNNVTLDCQGFNIDGDDTGFRYGIDVVGVSNVTVHDCRITDFGSGLRFSSTHNSSISNITVTSNPTAGIELSGSDDNTITNVTAIANGQNGVYLTSGSDRNNLTDITSSGGVSGIFLISSSFNIVKNSTVDGVYGLQIVGANDNNFTNIVASTATSYGVYLWSGAARNIFSNITANSNGQRGFSIDGNSNKIINSTINFQGGTNDVGIYLIRDSNTVENNIINSNYRGIYLASGADLNIILNNTFESNSDAGIYVDSSASPNTIYNNLLNNTNNVFFAGTVNINDWNTTEQSGNRVYSSGTDIGGNYWTNSTGTGFSDICVDADTNGFCDLGYNVTNDVACTAGTNCSSNTDFLAYSDEFIDPFDVGVCRTLSSSGSYKVINALSTTGTCITITSSDVTLDCQGFNIDGDDSGTDYGINVSGTSGSEFTNITINNCNITDFERGIYFTYVDNSSIDNSSSNSNLNYGIFLDSADSNNLTNVTTNLNTWGIGIFFADLNTIINSTANSNGISGVDFVSGSNTFENLIVKNNTQFDLDLTSASLNTCGSTFINVTGTDNKPIYFTNETVTLEHWNNNASLIIFYY